MSLSGKTAVVTGGSSGIGASIASALAARGAAVVAAGRRFSEPAQRPRPATIANARLDVTDDGGVSTFFDRVGPVDILVHAAGVAHFRRAGDSQPQELRDMVDVHLIGAAACTSAVLPAMRESGGNIVFIGSIATRFDLSECAGYAAAKYAQLGYARALAAEERDSGIRVTTAIVGATDTALWHSRKQMQGDEMASAAHVADVIVGLLSDRELVVDEIMITPPRGVL